MYDGAAGRCVEDLCLASRWLIRMRPWRRALLNDCKDPSLSFWHIGGSPWAGDGRCNQKQSERRKTLSRPVLTHRCEDVHYSCTFFPLVHYTFYFWCSCCIMPIWQIYVPACVCILWVIWKETLEAIIMWRVTLSLTLLTHTLETLYTAANLDAPILPPTPAAGGSTQSASL